MRCLDLFSGTGSATQALADAGWDRITSDLHQPSDLPFDVLQLDHTQLKLYGPFDLIWASPPCTAFSIASMGHHWSPDYTPKTPEAAHNQVLVSHTVQLILALQPRWWVIENPVGMLRKLPPVAALPRVTVDYCQFGHDYRKPTDLWTNMHLAPRRCKNGEGCHTAAPRGSRTGTQGLAGGNKARSMVPYGLSEHLLEVAESDLVRSQ